MVNISFIQQIFLKYFLYARCVCDTFSNKTYKRSLSSWSLYSSDHMYKKDLNTIKCQVNIKYSSRCCWLPSCRLSCFSWVPESQLCFGVCLSHMFHVSENSDHIDSLRNKSLPWWSQMHLPVVGVGMGMSPGSGQRDGREVLWERSPFFCK